MLSLAAVVWSISLDFIYKDIILLLLFMSVVLLFSYESGIVSSLLKARFLQKLGVLSFSIYMTHYFVIVCFKALLTLLSKFTNFNFIYGEPGFKVMDLGNAYFNNSLLIILLLVTILVSKFTYLHIEERGQRFFNNKRLVTQ